MHMQALSSLDVFKSVSSSLQCTGMHVAFVTAQIMER